MKSGFRPALELSFIYDNVAASAKNLIQGERLIIDSGHTYDDNSIGAKIWKSKRKGNIT